MQWLAVGDGTSPSVCLKVRNLFADRKPTGFSNLTVLYGEQNFLWLGNETDNKCAFLVSEKSRIALEPTPPPTQ